MPQHSQRMFDSLLRTTHLKWMYGISENNGVTAKSVDSHNGTSSWKCCSLLVAFLGIFFAVLYFTLPPWMQRTSCLFTPWNHCFSCFESDAPPETFFDEKVLFRVHRTVDEFEVVTLSTAQKALEKTYNSTFKTILIIHGFREVASRKVWIRSMTNAILSNENANIIVVDWTGLGFGINYFRTAADSIRIGHTIAKVLKILMALGGDPKNFHLIGHSLGAQIASFAASNLKGVGRITGLDPADLCFNGVGPEFRLDPSDADYVDVIHTDAAYPVPLGTFQPMGTVDFYPNGGMFQPGCPQSGLMRAVNITGPLFGYRGACSHGRSLALFLSSMSYECQWNISRCQSFDDVKNGSCTPCKPTECGQMGYAHGKTSLPEDRYNKMNLLHITTTAMPPFC